jgi:Flp pilus assembly protein TadD
LSRICIVASVVAVVFLLPVFGFAQQVNVQGSIQGKVLDRDGKPLAGAAIRIQNIAVNQVDEAKTNKNGGYTITGLLQGKYKVALIVDGKPVMARGETTGDEVYVNADSEQTVNFDMRSAPAVAPTNVPPAPGAGKGKSAAEKKADQEMRAAFNAGMAALKAQNFDEAIKQLQLAAEKDASQAAVFGNLGLALVRVKKYDDAAAAFKKSIALNPADAGVHNSLSLALGESGKIDEAKQEAQEVAKLDPSKAGQSYYNLGAILSERGKSKEAVELFKKAVEIDPKYAASYYQLGLAYFASPDTIPAAISVLEKYLELEPNGPNTEAARQLISAARAAAPSAGKKD